jgi:fibronectin-binding autotransporter adhesin
VVESSVFARVKRKRWLGCSVAALTAALGGTAYADCLPNPPTPMVCSGTTVDQITVSTSGVVNVATGALLQRPNVGNQYFALVVTSQMGAFPGTAVTLNVDGTISGGALNAVQATSAGPNSGFPATRLDVTVGRTGRIEGDKGVWLYGTNLSASGWAPVTGTVDNSGVIFSPTYAALLATDVQNSGFQSVTNRAGGVIQGGYGAIDGVVGVLDNAGLIDGGGGSAYRFFYNGYSSFVVYPSSVTNTGTMVASGYSPTISLPTGYVPITNSGVIRNDGAGAAIETGNFLTLTNGAGGVIQSAAATAIRAPGGTIVNAGTINGGIATTGSQGSATLLDNSQGTINGDVRFGSASDTLIARWDAAAGRIGGISGTIDGGGGTNTLRFDFTEDATLDSLMQSVALPSNFQKLSTIIGPNATVTLNGDAVDGLLIGGSGRFVTTGKVTGNGSAFITTVGPPYDYSATLGFKNTGEIASTFSPPGGVVQSSDFAVALQYLKDFVNTGTITATAGGGVLAGFTWTTPGGTFTNSGTIVADGAAVNVSSANFVNSGTIRSTAGTGLTLGNYGMTGTNTGVIEGGAYGATVYGALTNSGTINATNGVGVLVNYATFENLADGVVTGSKASIGAGFNARVINAGVLNGDVDFTGYYSYSTDVFIDNGGVLNGGLLMGGGEDVFVTNVDSYVDGKFKNVTGVVDGGDGVDRLILRVAADTTTKVATAQNFERIVYELGDDAKLSLTSDQPLTKMLMLAGKGEVDLSADMAIDDGYGIVVATPFDGGYIDPGDVSIVSRGALSFRVLNGYSSIGVALLDKSTFENAGSITVVGRPFTSPANTAITGGQLVTNSGTITLDGAMGISTTLKVVNSGSIVQAQTGQKSFGVGNAQIVENSGVIDTAGDAIVLNYYNYYTPTTTLPSVTNSGVIHSTTGNAIIQYSSGAATITNTATGQIVSDSALAIRTGGYGDTVRNDGSIVGAIDLLYGDDRLENYGAITGAVYLGDGNDTFVQWIGGKMDGVADGGYGLDTLVIDSTGGGTISTSQFINFESFKQIGDGTLNYVGNFGQGPIVLDGNSAAVKAGDAVTTWGGIAFAGGAGSEHLTVDGSISGGVFLGGGVDTVINRGAIAGAVQLGAGDDTYTEGWGSTASGAISGGAGADTYIVEMAGDRVGLHARTGFESLAVTGTGNLTLAQDQNWASVSLAGANLYLTSAAHTVGRLSGGDQDESVRIDADIAQVDLGGGADNLQVDFAQVAGAYKGGAGADRVRFTASTPVTVAGSLSGFETIALDGGQLAVSGVLGAAGETATFEGDAGQTLSILSGGALAGTVDLGAGDDLFQLAAGGQLVGTVLGGTGNDKVAIDLASDLSLRGDQLQQFEILQVTGTGALNFTGGAAQFDHLVTDSKDLTLAAGSSLNARHLDLGGGANTMTVGGAFTGVVDLGGGDDVLRLTTGGTFTGSAEGGAGSDRLELALGGTDAAPTALGSTPFNGFETLSLQSGVVSVSGDYGFDTIEIRNGRLIGLAGSRLAASNIVVAQGATFGSAGAVTGNIAVAGTLSPGASPGTMTVTGDVALASGSTALFELTPTVSDQLVVSGTVTIAQGATLKLVGAATLTPGRRLDLITAGGGIVGAFSTIDGAQGLNLHIAQTSTRLQALGLFTTDTGFSSQVSGVIGVLNTALIEDKVGASLIAAMPALVDPTTHKSDPSALARVTPQAYASATQLALEDGLSIVDASRAQARFAPDAPGLFGFGQAIDSRRTLDGDAALGVAKGKIDTTGGLAGVGYGVDSAWAGVFVGYLEGRQRLRDLDARTETDSFAIGVQGQVRIGAFQLGAMAAHDGADVDTRRAAPGGTTATGDYKLKSWIADVNLTYRAKLNADWAVQPRLGASYVRATRDGFVERGDGAFALTVQGDRSSTWLVDGQVEVLGGQAAGARLHPFASLGFRSTADGGDTTASGVLAGLATPIRVGGLDRGGTLATAGAGVGYDLAHGLTVSTTYAGEFGDGGRQAVLVGLNWKF